MMEVFDICKEISSEIEADREDYARDNLIKLLDYLNKHDIEYTPIVNHLIRQVGLFPYLRTDNAIWQDRLIFELFKVDIGTSEPITLHREQSSLLKKLLNGENIAVSAPTSFGKSFVIDAFISINKPKNVVLIVPTIALTDETRRRLYKKFSNTYKIITTTDVELAEKNIFIFPQERAINYVNKIDIIDILIIDEFYKASSDFDKERSPSLIKAILQLEKTAKQKYFLAPNISYLRDNPFTNDMEFLPLDFNTVFLEKYELYKDIEQGVKNKDDELLKILDLKKTKTLIYAGTYSEVAKVSALLVNNLPPTETKLLVDFSMWLSENYDKDWTLTKLIKKGTGVHNGRLHRSLSQIQVKLFEEDDGINNIISTSSIIEGMNTSAENVVIWRDRIGHSRLNNFTYRNIIGRGGRMFKYFIGQIYILEKPPEQESIQLNLAFPDDLLFDIEDHKIERELTPEQIAKIMADKEELCDLLGKGVFSRLMRENVFQSSNSGLIKKIASDIRYNPSKWNGLSYLNSDYVSNWDSSLYKIINLQPGNWDIQYSKFVSFIKVLSENWSKSIPELLVELRQDDIDIETFFNLERNATFKFASLLSDVNVLQKEILRDKQMDISPFISKISHAFLPSVVYQLEEYGLPRMISKKVHKSGLIDFLDPKLTIHKSIDLFNQIGKGGLIEETQLLDDFDVYIIDYFYDGITLAHDPQNN